MLEPTRVLHVVVNMNRGGAETLIMNLYRNMDRSKVQFDFLTCKNGVFDNEILELGGLIHRIPYITDVGPIIYNHILRKFFEDNPQYHIVHSHMDKMSGLVLRAAKKANIPIRIAHSHSTRSEGGYLTRVYKWYAGKLIKTNATNLLACSQTAADWLFGNRSEKVQIIRNGVDLNNFTYSDDTRIRIREELGIDESILAVGHVGRFSSPKNHTFLIDIFHKLIEIRPDSVLILAGDGKLRSAIEQKVKKLGLTEHVRFIGVRDDIFRVMQAFDIFVFPSIYEGLPVTVMEAQALGIPCLVSDAVTKEVCVDDEIVKFLKLDYDEIWVDQILFSAKRFKPSSNAALRAQGYDIATTAKWLQEYYRNLV